MPTSLKYEDVIMAVFDTPPIKITTCGNDPGAEAALDRIAPSVALAFAKWLMKTDWYLSTDGFWRVNSESMSISDKELFNRFLSQYTPVYNV